MQLVKLPRLLRLVRLLRVFKLRGVLRVGHAQNC